MRSARVLIGIAIILAPFSASAAATPSESSPFANLNPFFLEAPVVDVRTQVAAAVREWEEVRNGCVYYFSTDSYGKTIGIMFPRLCSDPDADPSDTKEEAQLKQDSKLGTEATKDKCLNKDIVIKSKEDIFVEAKSIQPNCNSADVCKTNPEAAGKTTITLPDGSKSGPYSNCTKAGDLSEIQKIAQLASDIPAQASNSTQYKPGGALTGKSGTLSFDNISLDSSLKDPFPLFPQSFSQTPSGPTGTTGNGSVGTDVALGQLESPIDGYQGEVPGATRPPSPGGNQNTGMTELMVGMQMGQLLNSLSQGGVNTAPPPPPTSQGSYGTLGAPAVAQVQTNQSNQSNRTSQGVIDVIEKLAQATGNAIDTAFDAVHDTIFSRGEATPATQAGPRTKTTTYTSTATEGTVTTYASVIDPTKTVTPIIFFNGNNGTPNDANAQSVFEQAKASGNVAVIVPQADCGVPANCVGAFAKKYTTTGLMVEAVQWTQLAVQGSPTYVAYSGGYAQLNAALQNCGASDCPSKIVVVDGYGTDNSPQNPNSEAIKNLAEWVKNHPGTSLSYECTSPNAATCNALKENLKTAGVSFSANPPGSDTTSRVHVYEAPSGTSHANALRAPVNGQNGPVAAALSNRALPGGTAPPRLPSFTQNPNPSGKSPMQFDFGQLLTSDGEKFRPEGAAALRKAVQDAAQAGKGLVVTVGNDPGTRQGGDVDEYKKAIDAVSRSGASVLLTGNCVSACVDVTALANQGRLYATPEAALKVHLGTIKYLLPGATFIETEAQATAAYPPALKEIISKNGGLTVATKEINVRNGLCNVAKCVGSIDDIPARQGSSAPLADNTKPPATNGCLRMGDSLSAMFTECKEIGGKQVYGGLDAKRDDVAASTALSQGSAFSTDLLPKLKNLTQDQIEQLQGKRILIDMGTNDPSNIKTLCAQPGDGCPISDSIKQLQKFGVDPRNIDVVGINNKYGVNDLLEKAAKAGNANYIDGSKYYAGGDAHLNSDGPKKILADIQNGRNGSYSTDPPSGAIAGSPPPSAAKALFAGGRYDETFKKIEADSGLAGRLPGILNMYGNIEGTGGNCNRASFSGPLGCFQYSKKTWLIDSARMNGGVPLPLEMRTDLAVSAQVTASSINYYMDTHGGLIRSSGINPYAGVYAFHNIGEDGAQKFLKAYAANPNAIASDVLDETTIGNNPIVYRGGGITLAQAEQNMLSGMNRTTPPARIAQPASTFTGAKVLNNGGNAFKKGSLGDPFVDEFDDDEDEWVTERPRPKTYKVNYGNNPFSSDSMMKMMLGNMLGGQLGNLFKGSQSSNTNQKPNPTPPPTTLSLSVQPTNVVRGKNITLGWSSDAALVNPPCQITQNGAVIATGNSGGMSITTSSSTPATLTFMLMCKAAQNGQTVQQSAVVNVQ